MTEPLADPRLDRALREVLARRDPGDAAAAPLVGRIDAWLRAEPVTGRIRWLRGPAQDRLPVVTGLAAAAVIVAVALLIVPDNGPTGPGGPTGSAGLDLTVAGPGLVPSTPGPGIWALIGLASLVLLVGGVIVQARLRRVALVIVGVALLAATWTVANQRAPVFGSFDGLITGVSDSAVDAEWPTDRLWVTARPGERWAVSTSIRNLGPLPIRIEGLADVYRPDDGSQWTAMWIQPGRPFEGGATVGDPATAVPWHPVELAPGDELIVFLVGRAGSCAAGPVADPGSRISVILSIPIVYSVAGWTSEAPLLSEGLGVPRFEVAIPGNGTCGN
jgi:hypothetical protein